MSSESKTTDPSSVEARCVRLNAKAATPAEVAPVVERQHTYVGIDSFGLSSLASGAVLRELVPGFRSGRLRPFPIKPGAIYPLEDAKSAFIAVAGSSRDRVILRP